MPWTILMNWRVWAAVSAVAGAWYLYHHIYTSGYNAAMAETREASIKLSMKLQKEKDDAVADAEKRLAVAQAAAKRSGAERDRLLDLLSKADGRIATASEAAVREYAATANLVFGQCVREYQDVAAKAQGHAADVQTLINAWPKR